jgi:REP element-mobilizing transposase RayT
MPDHVHALLAFPPTEAMSRVIGEWKHFHARHTRIVWQDGYFDHRIRHDAELNEKLAYIRNNPVVENLCAHPEDWPWFWEPGAELAKPPGDGAPGPPSPPPPA